VIPASFIYVGVLGAVALAALVVATDVPVPVVYGLLAVAALVCAIAYDRWYYGRHRP
jgi:hypothetical protein